MKPTLTERVAKNPRGLEVTPVFRSLEHFAVALRVGSAGFFARVTRAKKTSTFWSHSWHGGHWKNIFATETLYYASIIVFACRGVHDVAHSLRSLLGIDRGWWDDSFQWSCWSTYSGFGVASLVMMFWRQRTGVFLDCIYVSASMAITWKAATIPSPCRIVLGCCSVH